MMAFVGEIGYYYVEYLNGRLKGQKDVIKVRHSKYYKDELEHYAFGNIGWWPFEWGIDFKRIEHLKTITEAVQGSEEAE